MTSEQFIQWEREFEACPIVYMTFYGDGDWTGNVYCSREGAEFEAETSDRQIDIRSVHVMDRLLSHRRWG
jgi:hypothetical protein